MLNIVGIIPARGGSKSIKNKNIREFHGKPLISWTIECALNSNIDRVVVSTNDEAIRDISLNCGAEVPFLRPDELADDYSGVESVLKHAYEYFTNVEYYHVDVIVMLLPT